MNGALGSIETMYVQKEELVTNFPLVHNCGLEFGADFVVEDLEINVVTTVCEAAHDGVVGNKSVLVRSVNIKGCRGLHCSSCGRQL